MRDEVDYNRDIVDRVSVGYPHTVFYSNDPETQVLIDETWQRMDKIFTEAFYRGTNITYTEIE